MNRAFLILIVGVLVCACSGDAGRESAQVGDDSPGFRNFRVRAARAVDEGYKA